MRLANPGRDRKTFEFVVDAPAGWLSGDQGPMSITLDAGQKKDVSFSFGVPGEERWGLHRTVLILRHMGEATSVVPVPVHMNGPTAPGPRVALCNEWNISFAAGTRYGLSTFIMSPQVGDPCSQSRPAAREGSRAIRRQAVAGKGSYIRTPCGPAGVCA